MVIITFPNSHKGGRVYLDIDVTWLSGSDAGQAVLVAIPVAGGTGLHFSVHHIVQIDPGRKSTWLQTLSLGWDTVFRYDPCGSNWHLKMDLF